MEFNVIKHHSNTENVLLIFSPSDTKYLLYKFPFNGDKIQLRDTAGKYYFTKNKTNVFDKIKHLCKGKNIYIIGISKAGYVSLEIAKFLSESFKNTTIKVYLFNPMLILDKKIKEKENIIMPPSLLSFLKKDSKDITETNNLFVNKRFDLIYTYSSGSFTDNLNFEYFKKYVDYYYKLDITSHNCIFPFLKHVTQNTNLDHDGFNTASYSKNDYNFININFNNKLMSLDNLVNTNILIDKKIYNKN
jgi:hypothetical protein